MCVAGWALHQTFLPGIPKVSGPTLRIPLFVNRLPQYRRFSPVRKAVVWGGGLNPKLRRYGESKAGLSSYQVEMHDFFGEDCTDDGSGGVRLTTTKEPTGLACPRYVIDQ